MLEAKRNKNVVVKNPAPDILGASWSAPDVWHTAPRSMALGALCYTGDGGASKKWGTQLETLALRVP